MAEGGVDSSEILIGAIIRADGTLDTSRALRETSERPSVPSHWPTLYHATNLARPQWQGRESTLDQDTFIVGGLGLSCISEAARQQQEQQSRDPAMNFKTSHARGLSGQPVEIRVIVPAFPQTQVGHREIVADYASRYGEDRAREMLELANILFWKNRQGGRHPIVPRDMVLDKLDSRMETDGNRWKQMETDGNRVITYVPQVLEDIYEQEVRRQEEEK